MWDQLPINMAQYQTKNPNNILLHPGIKPKTSSRVASSDHLAQSQAVQHRSSTT